MFVFKSKKVDFKRKTDDSFDSFILSAEVFATSRQNKIKLAQIFGFEFNSLLGSKLREKTI